MNKKYRDKNWLHNQYINKRKNTNEIANICGCCQTTICNWLHRFDIKTRNKSQSKLVKSENRKYRNKEWLFNQYINRRKTTREIAELCDATFDTVRRWLHHFDIEIRAANNGFIKKQLPEDYRYCGQCNSSKHISEFYQSNINICKTCLHKRKVKRRRGLGFNALNEKYEGSVGHHIDDGTMLYIPEELHLSCYAGSNSDLHRTLVFNELVEQGMEKEVDLILSHFNPNWEDLNYK